MLQITRNTPFLCEGGCSERLRPIQTNGNVSLPTFPRISHWWLHFYWFCNRQPHMCLTTTLHSTTSINRRLLPASKVESLTLSNPHFELYWLERQSVCRYTPPIQSNVHRKYKLPPWTTTFNPAPTTTFWSDTISGVVCGNYKLSPFFTYKKSKLSHIKP